MEENSATHMVLGGKKLMAMYAILCIPSVYSMDIYIDPK